MSRSTDREIESLRQREGQKRTERERESPNRAREKMLSWFNHVLCIMYYVLDSIYYVNFPFFISVLTESDSGIV